MGQGEAPAGFILAVSAWLWFTVLFANFAEALAEGRGKAQADALRRNRRDVIAYRVLEPDWRSRDEVPGSVLVKGDYVRVEAGQIIPADGEVVEGIASVDESAITGESAPVIRESGGDRSAVTGGTKVLSDWLIIRVTAEPGDSFLDRMIAMVEGAKRQKTPNEIALNILLAALTIIFLLVTATLLPFSKYSVQVAGQGTPVTITVLAALLVCLIPTTIGGLLSAIGIAGMDRVIRHNVVAMSGRAVEAAGDVDVLLLDKTGTDHAGQPPGGGVPAGPRRRRGGTGRRRPAVVPGRRNPRGAVHRRAGQGEVRPARAGTARGPGHVRALPGPDAHERRGLDGCLRPRRADSQGGPRRHRERTWLNWAAECQRKSTTRCAESPSKAARRWSSAGMRARWASSTSRTSSRAA